MSWNLVDVRSPVSFITQQGFIVSKFKEFEHVWAKVEIADETHIFVSVYFPPNNALKDIYDKFFGVVEEIMSSLPPKVKLHVFGDFNQGNVDLIPDMDNEYILLPVFGENETLN